MRFVDVGKGILEAKRQIPTLSNTKMQIKLNYLPLPPKKLTTAPNSKPETQNSPYSDRKLLTGFASAARIVCVLTVKKATATAAKPAATNIHHCSVMR